MGLNPDFFHDINNLLAIAEGKIQQARKSLLVQGEHITAPQTLEKLEKSLLALKRIEELLKNEAKNLELEKAKSDRAS